MSNQTLQKSRAKRRARVSASTRPGTFNRQTARLEGRRDGKPLIFGWGGHLTRRQKELLQRRAALAFVSLVGLIVLGVGVFGVIQQNVLIPNQALVKINGVAVSQDQYRKALAYDAQVVWNRVKGELKEQGELLPKIQAGDAAAAAAPSTLYNGIRLAHPWPPNRRGFTDQRFDPPCGVVFRSDHRGYLATRTQSSSASRSERSRTTVSGVRS